MNIKILTNVLILKLKQKGFLTHQNTLEKPANWCKIFFLFLSEKPTELTKHLCTFCMKNLYFSLKIHFFVENIKYYVQNTSLFLQGPLLWIFHKTVSTKYTKKLKQLFLTYKNNMSKDLHPSRRDGVWSQMTQWVSLSGNLNQLSLGHVQYPLTQHCSINKYKNTEHLFICEDIYNIFSSGNK